LRKPVADLKGAVDPGKLCIEVCGKTVRSDAETTLQSIVLRGADLANPPILKDRQDRKENQEKTNQDKAGLRAYYHTGIIVTAFRQYGKKLLTAAHHRDTKTQGEGGQTPFPLCLCVSVF
jgi:hypothetical protein